MFHRCGRGLPMRTKHMFVRGVASVRIKGDVSHEFKPLPLPLPLPLEVFLPTTPGLSLPFLLIWAHKTAESLLYQP